MCVTYFIDSYRFAVEFDHVHDLYGVLGILLVHELNETVALMILRDSILWHVHVDHRASLNEKLPEKRLRHLLIKTTNINGGIC